MGLQGLLQGELYFFLSNLTDGTEEPISRNHDVGGNQISGFLLAYTECPKREGQYSGRP
jgi:hypothetical protein